MTPLSPKWSPIQPQLLRFLQQLFTFHPQATPSDHDPSKTAPNAHAITRNYTHGQFKGVLFPKDSRAARPTRANQGTRYASTETRKLRLLPSVRGQRKDRGLGIEEKPQLSAPHDDSALPLLDRLCHVHDFLLCRGGAGGSPVPDHTRACLSPGRAVAARTPDL